MVSLIPEVDLLSIGKLAEVLQASPARIEVAAERAGVRVSLRLNGVPYFNDADVDEIRDHLPPRTTRS